VTGAGSRAGQQELPVGAELLAEAELERVELDVKRGRARIECTGASVLISGLRAGTLLSPWDGAPGVVEHLRVVAIDAGEICLELKVRYATVPRVHRIVCTDVRRS